MQNKSSGIFGILGVIGAVILFLVLRSFFPSLTTILLVIAGIALFLVVLLVVLVIYFSKKEPREQGGKTSSDANAVLAKARSKVVELRQLEIRARNQQVRDLSEEICGIADKILCALKEQPKDIPSARQFLNYYLPTLGSILLKYVQVEESGMPTAELTENIITCLGDIKIAMEKQYANLFEDDMLDLSVEMEALTLACKRDGLLDDEDFSFQDVMTKEYDSK